MKSKISLFIFLAGCTFTLNASPEHRQLQAELICQSAASGQLNKMVKQMRATLPSHTVISKAKLLNTFKDMQCNNLPLAAFLRQAKHEQFALMVDTGKL